MSTELDLNQPLPPGSGHAEAGRDDALRPSLPDDYGQQYLDRQDIDQLFFAVQGAIARERQRPLSALRSWPTWVRRGLVCGVLGLLLAGFVGSVRRARWQELSVAESLVAFGGVAVFSALSLWAVTRPMHRPALPRAWVTAISLAGIVSALVGALYFSFFAAEPATSTASYGLGPCFGVGLFLGTVVFGVVRLVDRGALFGPLLAGCGAGLGANLLLGMHCAAQGIAHQLIAHFGMVVVFIAVGLGLAWWHAHQTRRRAGPPS